MNRFRRPALITIALGICIVDLPASASDCTAQQQTAAETSVETLTDWPRIRAFFDAYRTCDDGGVAEGVTEAVARLLADHWDQLATLVLLIRQQPALRPFVLTHIDSTTGRDDLQRIRFLATHHCSHDLSTLCKDIARAAQNAIR
jgi:hypothetical protein